MSMINKEHKDRLFCFLFGSESNKEWTLSLYNAVNGTAARRAQGALTWDDNPILLYACLAGGAALLIVIVAAVCVVNRGKKKKKSRR